MEGIKKYTMTCPQWSMETASQPRIRTYTVPTTSTCVISCFDSPGAEKFVIVWGGNATGEECVWKATPKQMMTSVMDDCRGSAAEAIKLKVIVAGTLWVSMTYGCDYGTSNIIPVHSLCLESWKIHNYGNSTSL